MQDEEVVYAAVAAKELTVDAEGRIWRHLARRWDRWARMTRAIPCQPRRAENSTGAREYLQVRVMVNGVRATAMAHRIVWRHFMGSIPPGMTINHKNGVKTDNRPENLELATPSEQAIHARQVLKRGRLDQGGEKNAMAKLTEGAVTQIRARRAAGESLKEIAETFGVSDRTVSKIALGQRWRG